MGRKLFFFIKKGKCKYVKEKKWIIFLIVVLTLTLSACTSNITPPNNNNTKGQGIENDSTNASNKSNNNQDTNINNTNAAYEDIKVTPKKSV